MALFGRKKSNLNEPEASVTPEDSTPPGEPGIDRDWQREVDGPFDISERSELGPRVDLGVLRLPAAQGMELRLEVQKATKEVTALTLGVGGSHVQIQVFAAPRSGGLWREIRGELAEGLREKGGTAQEVAGLLGTDLQGTIVSAAADGGTTTTPVRFIGVDGPRWFLRAVVNGAAVEQEAALAPILKLIRGIVINRGDEPRPPREVLPLTPSEKVAAAIAAGGTQRRSPAGGSGTPARG